MFLTLIGSAVLVPCAELSSKIDFLQNAFEEVLDNTEFFQMRLFMNIRRSFILILS